MRYLAICALLLLSAFTTPHAWAQAGTVAVSYSPGWNMVGGPAGTDLSPAGSLYVYGPGGYTVLNTTTATTCQGYWVYLTGKVSVSLSGSATGPTQSCSLQSGWNLVGNPFAGAAQLPPGTVAYHWSPSAGAYSLVDAIPMGGADWVYASSAGPITLQFVPVSSGNLVIQGLTYRGPYQVHVGATVTLQLGEGLQFRVGAPPELLQLVDSGNGADGPYWTWRAVATGTALITVTPRCLDMVPKCALPTLELEVDILP